MSETTLDKTLLEIPRELTKDKENAEKPTSGGETVKDEETVEKPKDEPPLKITHLGRKITNVFKKKPETAQGDFEEPKEDETQKVAATDDEDKKEMRVSMQSEKKQDSKAVKDEFEIVENGVKKEYPDIAKQGKLHRESQILKRYEERYFAFHNGILYSFKDGKTKKQFKMSKTCNVKRGGNKRFEIETPSRTFKFQASTEEDQAEWTKVIQDYIDNLSKPSSDEK
ncbi:PH domain-like protein [Gigaspora margarita]|uniref:PH domain-like protein n=1 Tax=Gigaspora margarita TaxID=4874 RepID=A0A8H4A4Z6_GIGMA|nr:PH domain-like protein [Gigaspora margarita]